MDADGARPQITSAPSTLGYGGTTQITVDRPASEIDSVVLVRNPTPAHVTDADQRNVVLRVVARLGNRLTPQDREEIVATIATRLGEPPPTRDQITKFKRARRQLLRGLR